MEKKHLQTISRRKREKTKAIGKRAEKIAHYYGRQFYVNKLRRILKHNGLKNAQEWAKINRAEGVLRGLIKERGNV